jgi:autotransporter-associated beta strand protein
MTGHLVGTGAAGNLNLRNQQIRDYCTANDKILYDFADIESYDPDGLTNYMALNANDNCDYSGGNWALQWQATHTSGVDWYPCSPAHTQALNGNLKAYAAWTLWTEITTARNQSTWEGPGGGSFNLASNWVNNSVPNGASATANFSGNITAQSAVTLDSPVTLRTINFDSAMSYTIAGASGLALQASSGSASVNVLSGSHTIAAGVSLTMSSPTVFRVSNPTDSLTVAGNISGANPLTKDGLGTLVLQGTNAYSGLTTVQGGTLQLNGAAARNPVLNLAGSDIRVGKIVFDYSGAGDSSPATDVLDLLTDSCTGGSWSAGKFRSTTAAAEGTTLGWIDDTTAKQLTVMVALPGDADLTGQVDSADLALLIGNYNLPGVWADGDFNYDGVIDSTDLALVIGNYNQSLPSEVFAGDLDAAGLAMLGAAGIHVVPEPGTLALLATGLLSLLAFAWRRGRVCDL